ncbi:MAG: hypothetical protein SGBAC_003814, partial [Bacillariaceae sp.]
MSHHQPNNNRIVLLFDLDCFYAQCERVRLGLELDCSLALLQWNSTLAVTYPARTFGIARGDSWDAVAQKSQGKCHAIHLHILKSTTTATTPTTATATTATTTNSTTATTTSNTTNDGDGEQKKKKIELEAQDADLKTAFDNIYKLNPQQQIEARKQIGVRRDHNDGKACLERYRLASMSIFNTVLESLTKHLGKENFILERASIDEFYLDITKYCYSNDNNEYTGIKGSTIPNQKPTAIVGDSSNHSNSNSNSNSNSSEDYNDEQSSPLNVALQKACQVSQQIRTDVWNNLGFTMSAGISTNKMMAKLAASFGKPNGQALLVPNNFETLMETTKIRKVRNFGGKLGRKVTDLLLHGKEDATMGDLAQIPLPVLFHHFSQETALMVFDACRGNDNEPVKETTGALVKSITAFKSFTATSVVGEIEKWLQIISTEIVTRVARDMVRNKRYPKTCTLNYTYYTTPNGRRPNDGSHRSQRNTKSVRLQYPNSEGTQMTRKAENLQEQAMEKLIPILQQHKLRGVGMSANNFETKGQPGVSSIESFFSTDKKVGDGTSSHRFSASSIVSGTQPSIIRAGVEQYFPSKSDTSAEPSSSEAKHGHPPLPSPNDSDETKAITPNVSIIETKSDEELAKALQA